MSICAYFTCCFSSPINEPSKKSDSFRRDSNESTRSSVALEVYPAGPPIPSSRDGCCLRIFKTICCCCCCSKCCHNTSASEFREDQSIVSAAAKDPSNPYLEKDSEYVSLASKERGNRLSYIESQTSSSKPAKDATKTQALVTVSLINKQTQQASCCRKVFKKIFPCCLKNPMNGQILYIGHGGSTSQTRDLSYGSTEDLNGHSQTEELNENTTNNLSERTQLYISQHPEERKNSTTEQKTEEPPEETNEYKIEEEDEVADLPPHPPSEEGATRTSISDTRESQLRNSFGADELPAGRSGDADFTRPLSPIAMTLPPREKKKDDL